MLRIACSLLLLIHVGWAQPVFLPNGAEGLDLKSYDARNRAPQLKHEPGLTVLQVPLAKAEALPRKLQRAEFRSVGQTALNVKQGEETREYFCPSRLTKALNMEEWLSGTPILMGVYAGYEGKPAVVSLMPETMNGVAPTGWTPLSEQVYRSPMGDSFVCLLPAGEVRVMFAGQSGQGIVEDGLIVYGQSEWRVAVGRQRALVAPVQDFPMLLESLKSFFF